jgi:hypothetical protein
MDKQNDVMAILKLYELRRDDRMRDARAWYFTEFNPENVMDIIGIFRAGQAESASYRMVTSYWDMAAAFVLNGGIDRQMFLDSGTEHVFVFTKIQPFLADIREMFREPDYLINLERLVLSIPDVETMLESRRRLATMWKR